MGGRRRCAGPDRAEWDRRDVEGDHGPRAADPGDNPVGRHVPASRRRRVPVRGPAGAGSASERGRSADARTQDLRVLLARVEARAGSFQQASEGLARIPDRVRRARARLDLAEQLQEAGKGEEALAAVDAFAQAAASWGEKGQADRDELMRQAAVVQARCGGLEVAEATVYGIEAPFHAATACTYVARDLRELEEALEPSSGTGSR